MSYQFLNFSKDMMRVYYVELRFVVNIFASDTLTIIANNLVTKIILVKLPFYINVYI